MKWQSLAHSLVLALFLASSLLSAFVGPTQAGVGEPQAMGVALEAGMPCCPPDDGQAPDCARHCPALIFCLGKIFPGMADSGFINAVLPLVAMIAPRDDRTRASRPQDPPARPPRTAA